MKLRWFDCSQQYYVNKVLIYDFIHSQVHMPAFMAAHQRQLRTRDANLTRLVTKNRWVVESVNGDLKCWKWLGNVICNKMLPFVGDFFRIVGAVLNWQVYWVIISC